MTKARGLLDSDDVPISERKQGFFRSWTMRELNLLKRFLEVDGMSIADAAENLGRGYGTTYMHARTWGFSFQRENPGKAGSDGRGRRAPSILMRQGDEAKAAAD